MTLGYQHQWKTFPQLGTRCQICSRVRTPDSEAQECLKPEPLDIGLYKEQ